MPNAGVTHDCTIEDASAATPIYGYMFYRWKNARRPFGVKDFRSIAPRLLTTEQLTEAQFPADVELLWTENDWQVGFGGTNHKKHPNKLGSSYQIDTSDPGKIKLARDLVSTSLDTAATQHRVTGFAIVGTEIWAFIGRDVYSWNYTNKNWVKGTVPNATANVYTNGVAYKGNTYAAAWVAATNVADTYIYKADADANWTLGTLTDKKCKYFGVAGNLMYGANWSDGVHYVRTSTDPTNTGAWSGAYVVGGLDSEITALVPNGDQMLICKTDGIYTIQPDGSVKNLTPQYDDADQHPDNFKGSFNWNGHILLPMGTGGMKELVGSRLVDVSINLYAPLDTQLHGRVVAINGNPSELYIMILETGNTRYHVLKATWREFQGFEDYRWHHVARQAYTTATDDDQCALFADGVPNASPASTHRRILVGVLSTGSTIGPFYIPTVNDTDDVYQDGDDADAITTVIDFGMPKVAKHFSTIDFETDNLGSGGTAHYIEVSYRVDTIGGTRAIGSDTGWTFVTGSQATSKLTSDQQTLTFAKEITGKRIELRFRLFQGTTTTTTPELHKYTLRAQLRPASLKTVPLTFYCADDQMLLNGKKNSVMSIALTQLRTWNEGANEVVLRVPASIAIKGADAQRAFTVVLLPGFMFEEEIESIRGRRPELVVHALAAEVNT